MESTGNTYIYIAATPKRWRVRKTYRTLMAMNRLSEFENKGYALGGVHPNVGIQTRFVLNLQFASLQEKEEYENTNLFSMLLKDLKRYSKRRELRVLR